MRRSAVLFAIFGFLALAATLPAQPQYPEGVPVPATLTPAEAAWIAVHPLGGTDAVTPPPTGPVHCVAEYEPMEALLMSWEGGSSLTAILQQMTQQVTTTGSADVYMVVDNAAEQTTVQTQLAGAGINMARVKFVVQPTDTIWIRDYGPRYIYQGACRAVVDHTYNRPRPLDDVFPAAFAALKNQAFYEHQLVHGGGNYHLDALGRAHASRLTINENPSLTEQQIHDIWQAYQNVDTRFHTPFPTSVDGTQHIDMWMQVFADDKVMISDWPNDVGSTQDQICDNAAALLTSVGYTVYRIPARSVGGVHYTYTNVVLCNNLVMIPSYTNTTVAPHNAQALAAWTAAMPGKTVVQIPSQAIVGSAGVLHCIVMHVPLHLGGVYPTAYLKSLNGGQVLQGGAATEIRWASDDDLGVVNVDLLLSTDDGQSYPTVIAAGIAPTGSYSWTVPNVCTARARLRVVARDAQGRTGSDDSDASFTILGSPQCGAANIPYGAGKPGLNGVPVLSSTTPPRVPSVWTGQITQSLPNGYGWLIAGLAPAAIPFDGTLVLVNFTAYFPLALSPTGTAAIVLPVPNEPALLGVSLFWQFWAVGDPGAAGLGYSATNGLETRLGL